MKRHQAPCGAKQMVTFRERHTAHRVEHGIAPPMQKLIIFCTSFTGSRTKGARSLRTC